MPEPNVRIFITTDTAQYGEIVRHLRTLREREGGTNTAIVLDALRARADSVSADQAPHLKAA